MKAPLGVRVVSLFFLVAGFIMAVDGAFSLPSLFGAFVIFWGFVALLCSWGLVSLSGWAWKLAVLFCAVFLVYDLLFFLHGFPLELVILPYLVWKRKAFGIGVRA